MKYKLLSKQIRLGVREIAANCYRASGGHREVAIHRIRKRVPRYVKSQLGSFIGSVLVGVAIDLAIALITYWIKNALSSKAIPQGGFAKGEPGA